MALDQLALYGGRPVRETLLPYGHQSIDERDIEAVTEVMRGDWLTQGPTVEEFERAFADYLGRRHAVAFANGTAALHGACAAAGLQAGDEVIVPAITFAATANTALYTGAKPVFADVEAETGLLDPNELDRLRSKRTKAIFPMHYAGLPVDMEPVEAFAREHGLLVIEDACHALGATYDGGQAGTFGEMACFSFHPVKPLTTGEGGMVVTDSDEFAERLRIFRNHGNIKTKALSEQYGGWHYEMRSLGYNYRLTDMQAALGLSQLKKVDRLLQQRWEHAAFYDKAFAGFAEIGFLRPGKRCTCGYHLYPVLFDMKRLSCDKKTLFAALRAEGIGVQVHYIPVPQHPYYQELGYDVQATPRALEFFRREISIPLFAGMSAQDRDDVVCAVDKVLRAFGK